MMCVESLCNGGGKLVQWTAVLSEVDIEPSLPEFQVQSLTGVIELKMCILVTLYGALKNIIQQMECVYIIFLIFIQHITSVGKCNSVPLFYLVTHHAVFLIRFCFLFIFYKWTLLNHDWDNL